MSIQAKSLLLEYTAKQNIFNIKYSAKKNDTTFYLKGSDTLALSTNYKAFEILKNKDISEFGVIKNSKSSTYLIYSFPNQFEKLTPLASGTIYYFNSETKKLLSLGSGIQPKFSADGNFISYFHPESNRIIFRKILNIDNQLEIKLNSKIVNFRPQVEIIDENNIYYTDRSNENFEGLIKLDFPSQKRVVLTKAESIQTKYEICRNDNGINVLETNYDKKGYTFIYNLALNEMDIAKRNFLFDSKSGSATQLTCTNNELFFIKYFGDNSEYSELFMFDLAQKKAYIISDLDFVTNYFKFEDNIYIPFRRSIYATQDKEKNWLISKEFKETLTDEVSTK